MRLKRTFLLLTAANLVGAPVTVNGLARTDVGLVVSATVLPTITMESIEVPTWHDRSGRMLVQCIDGVCPRFAYPLITLEDGLLWPLGPTLLY